MMTRYWRSLTSSPRWILVVIVFVILLTLCSWIWKAQLISDVGPTWRRITVGQSTVNDVIAILGEPSSVESGWGQIVYVYQEGRFEWGMHRIVIRGGVVQGIEEDVLAYSYDIRLTQLIDQYGKPDYVMWSRDGPDQRIAVFVQDGVLVSATALPLNEAQVTRAFYYRPRSLVRLLVDFRAEISITNPFPNSDVVGPRDPWFDTS